MAILSTDIKNKLTTTAGSAGDSTAQADPNASLGKYFATTDIVTATTENLFDNVTGDENTASDVEYRGVGIENRHGTLTLESAVVWLSSEVAGGADAAIGLYPAGVVPVGQAGAQMAEIANESTAPAGVTFTAPTSKGTGLSIGNIAAGNGIGFWVRRTATASAAATGDGATWRVEGDTAA